MKVLLSAYACSPGTGSEPGVGFQTLMAVAEDHDVWVITRQKNADAIERHLSNHPSKSRVNVVALELGPRSVLLKRRLGAMGLQWYYDRWQIKAGEVAVALQAKIDFDVTHHVTFSADWGRAGVASLDVPFIWGPIGGGVTAPAPLLPTLGWRGILSEIGRRSGRALLRRRRSYHRSWRVARVILLQNRETGELGPDGSDRRLLPNSTSVDLPRLSISGERTNEVVVVGRLIPWKGGLLALRSFAQIENQTATLVFVGEGRERNRLEAAAQRMGIDKRVRFRGSLPRPQALELVARAGVFLHLAVHEENSMAVGEALSLGTPVVCLDWGGPAELLRQWSMSPGEAVSVSTTRDTTRAVARAIDRFLGDPPPIPSEPFAPMTSYATSLLEAYEDAHSDS